MGGRGLDPARGGLKIEQGSAARRTRDVIGLEDPAAGRLQNVVSKTQRLSGRLFSLHQDRVTDTIANQRCDRRL